MTCPFHSLGDAALVGPRLVRPGASRDSSFGEGPAPAAPARWLPLPCAMTTFCQEGSAPAPSTTLPSCRASLGLSWAQREGLELVQGQILTQKVWSDPRL